MSKIYKILFGTAMALVIAVIMTISSNNKVFAHQPVCKYGVECIIVGEIFTWGGMVFIEVIDYGECGATPYGSTGCSCLGQYGFLPGHECYFC